MNNNENWWETAVFYQIYMPAFTDNDTTAFRMLNTKIPYYRQLGITGIWLTPFYPSPKIDNGYDVSDYQNIDPKYGTLEEFDAFLENAHKAGIKVIADIVLNHTSDQHRWFKDSLHTQNNKEDWYLWSDEIPNNWESFFGGSAWEWSSKRGAYYYHSFSKEQPDLNFRNPDVEQAAHDILRFWQQRGIDGFRLDVINNLTTGTLHPDNPYNEAGEQLHLYDVNQAGIETILRNLRSFCDQTSDTGTFLVGEISSEDLPLIKHYASDAMLHTTFNFNLGSIKTLDPTKLHTELCAMHPLYKDAYPTLFFGSHDMRRSASRFQMDEDQIKTLCLLQLTFRGIPFLYYGEEIGMRDQQYNTLADAKDCQALIAYEEVKKRGGSEEEAMTALREKSRDYSRAKMDWQEAERQINTPTSLLAFYRTIITLRKSNAALSGGDCSSPVLTDGILSFDRIPPGNGQTLRIILNFTDLPKSLTAWNLNSATLLIATSKSADNTSLPGHSGAIFSLPAATPGQK